jgi:hypothetical protein
MFLCTRGFIYTLRAVSTGTQSTPAICPPAVIVAAVEPTASRS